MSFKQGTDQQSFTAVLQGIDQERALVKIQGIKNKKNEF
jgi:hypothetical protein